MWTVVTSEEWIAQVTTYDLFARADFYCVPCTLWFRNKNPRDFPVWFPGFELKTKVLEKTE